MSTPKQNSDGSSQAESSEPRRKLELILDLLRRQHGKLKRRRNQLLTFIPLTILIVGATLLFYAESQLYLHSAVKIGAWFVLLGTAGSVGWYLSKRFTVPDFTDFYRELTYKTDLPNLQHALDLQRFPDRHSSLFRDAAIRSNVEEVEIHDLEGRYQRYATSRPEYSYYQYGVGSFLLSGAILLLASTSLTDGIVRSAQFWKSYQPPNPYTFTVKPGDKTIEQGSSVTPEIVFRSEERPERVTLGIKTSLENQYRLQPMTSAGDRSYTGSPVSLTSNATYFIRMGKYESETYNLTVQLRPRFSKMKAIIDPPEYTGLDTSHVRYPFSRLQAYPGSEITLSTVANKPLTQLRLQRSGDSADTLTPVDTSDTRYRHQFQVAGPDTLQFTMRDSSGLTNQNPFRFSIRPLTDERPFVSFVRPDSSLEISEPDSLTLVYEGGDDFGLIRSTLRYEIQRAFVEKPEERSIQIPRPSQNQQTSYRWDLNDLDLKPRDRVTFWISVTDNDAVSNYKSATTRRLTLKVPSMADFASNMEQKESDVQQTMEDVSQSFEQMSQEYNQFKEEMKRNPTGGYEQEQQLKKVQEKQKEFQEKVEKLNKKFEKVKKELQKNDMLSEETKKAYKELQKLMKDIDKPELQEALKKLQKAVQQMNQNKLKKALEDYEFKEKSYREQLERTIDLFKKLKMNSDLEKMAKSLESLSKQEQELSQSKSPASEKIKKQQAIKQDARQMESQLDSLAEQAPQDARQQMQKLEQQAKQQMKKLQKQLQQNIQEMKKSGNSSQSRSQQKKLQKQMKQMASQMRQSKSQMNQRRMQVNMEAIKEILYTLINLSESQEELTRDTEPVEGGSRGFVELARQQKNIERQFNKVGDSLSAVASDIPMVSSMIIQRKNQLDRRLDRSVEQLSERNKGNAITAERQVLSGINELSSMLAQLLDQMKRSSRSGKGGGSSMSMQQMVKKLQQMSGQQQKLNKMMQQMMNQMQGNRLSKNQIQRMKQMARQQNQIRKQLEQMRKQGGMEPGDKLMSQMQRLNDEMEQTIRDLRGGQTDRRMLKRQKNILSQMLNAKDAINKRDKSDKRKARQPDKTYEQTSPDITLEELQKKIRQRMQDPSMTRFADDYQQLIEVYFQLLSPDARNN